MSSNLINPFQVLGPPLHLTFHILNADAIAYSGAWFGLGSGPIHLDDVRCTGSEAALVNCSYDPITTDCSHYEDAGVQCQGKQ